jgi:hypothetical protein
MHLTHQIVHQVNPHLKLIEMQNWLHDIKFSTGHRGFGESLKEIYLQTIVTVSRN